MIESTRLLKPDELREIAERERKATPGPWQYSYEWYEVQAGKNVAITERTTGYVDGKFIAAARTDIPRLLAHIEAQQAEIERYKTALERICGNEPDSLYDAQLIAEEAL
ncbi:hypothetical protein [Aneurinibacillus migulanus]|uniref:hypothetical protein n=1 Tax=Aneurinibacillus migulanus TaxID=47500 RepID=UPI0020A218A1|nr:hypothetical protein [Aneurinibacillus migulanus]MCP1354597.1 hypothetical protein [Aneurinibacillus migulanus]